MAKFVRQTSGNPDAANGIHQNGDSNDSGVSGIGGDGNGDDITTPGVPGVVIDPTTLTGDSSDGDSATRKRRGRPPGSGSGGRPKGSGTKSPNQKSKDAALSLNAILFSLHLMGAQFLKIPELVISEDESKLLGTAINNVMELYDMSVIPQEYVVWTNLLMVAGSIYGPRIIAHTINEKKKKHQEPTPFVVPQYATVEGA